jgi:predicted RNA-binding protein YlqC (UPF0109 family)
VKELVQFLASSLVDDPSSVQVYEKGSPEDVTYCLSVKREDLGKVIGKKGRTAKAMRALLAAAGARQKKRVSLEIIEPPAEEIAKEEHEQAPKSE